MVNLFLTQPPAGTAGKSCGESRGNEVEAWTLPNWAAVDGGGGRSGKWGGSAFYIYASSPLITGIAS